MEYLKNAPSDLVALVERQSSFRERDTLVLLLRSPIMGPAWNEIEKRLLRDSKIRRGNVDDLIRQNVHLATWHDRIWRQVQVAKRKSRVPPPSRTKKRSYFNQIAAKARKLNESMANGPLDKLSYEFFPDDTAQTIFKTPKWSELDADQRGQIANRNWRVWPSFTELLAEVVQHAEKQAKEAMTEDRTVDRETFDRPSNYFIRHLSKYFRTFLQGPMDGTIARITTVVLNRPFDEELVKRARHHSKV